MPAPRGRVVASVAWPSSRAAAGRARTRRRRHRRPSPPVPAPDRRRRAHPGRPSTASSASGSEQLAFHDHAHLAVFVDGEQRTVPAGHRLRHRRHVPLLAAQPHARRRHPHGVARAADVHARQLLRHLGPAAQRDPGRPGQGHGHRVRRRQAVHRRPARPSGSTSTSNIQLDVGKVVPFKDYKYGEGSLAAAGRCRPRRRSGRAMPRRGERLLGHLHAEQRERVGDRVEDRGR